MQEFEKRYDGLAVEKSMQEFWQENEVYKFAPDASRPIYSIDTPPPTVNGKLHIAAHITGTHDEKWARDRR